MEDVSEEGEEGDSDGDEDDGSEKKIIVFATQPHLSQSCSLVTLVRVRRYSSSSNRCASNITYNLPCRPHTALQSRPWSSSAQHSGRQTLPYHDPRHIAVSQTAEHPASTAAAPNGDLLDDSIAPPTCPSIAYLAKKKPDCMARIDPATAPSPSTRTHPCFTTPTLTSNAHHAGAATTSAHPDINSMSGCRERLKLAPNLFTSGCSLTTALVTIPVQRCYPLSHLQHHSRSPYPGCPSICLCELG